TSKASTRTRTSLRTTRTEAPGEPVAHRMPGAEGPGPQLFRADALEPGELTAQPHLTAGLEVVGQDELVALGEGVDADRRHHRPLEAQLLAQLAEHGRLRLLVPLQEPGDKAVPGLGPPHRADQEHLAFMLHQAGHHRNWVVVEDEAAVRSGAGHSLAPARL